MSDSPIFDNIDKPAPIYGHLTGDNKTVKPSKRPEKKVIAATVGAGVGPAVSAIGVYIIEAVAGIDIPNDIESSIAIVVSAGLAFVAGYFKGN